MSAIHGRTTGDRMDYFDEWRTELLPEEVETITYADWESWCEPDVEHLTVSICLICGNALQGLSWIIEGEYYFHCEVCL